MPTKNQAGLTLIELLLALSIVTTIGILIWSVFFQGFNYSKKATTTNQMQQEANIIISSLTTSHRKLGLDSYEIQSSSCKISISKDSSVIQEYEHPQLCFYLGEKAEDPFTETVTEYDDDVPLTLTVQEDKNEPNLKITVETILSRLEGDTGDD